MVNKVAACCLVVRTIEKLLFAWVGKNKLQTYNYRAYDMNSMVMLIPWFSHMSVTIWAYMVIHYLQTYMSTSTIFYKLKYLHDVHILCIHTLENCTDFYYCEWSCEVECLQVTPTCKHVVQVTKTCTTN